MPLRVACPTCAAVVQIPDEFAGKRVRCPKCKNAFVAPGEVVLQAQVLSEPEPEEEEQEPDREQEERPRKKKLKKKKRPRYDDDDDTHRGQGGWLDGQFSNTPIPFLVLFPLCCGIVAIIFAILGVCICREPQARTNAWLVLIISVIWIVVVAILRVSGVLPMPGGR